MFAAESRHNYWTNLDGITYIERASKRSSHLLYCPVRASYKSHQSRVSAVEKFKCGCVSVEYDKRNVGVREDIVIRVEKGMVWYKGIYFYLFIYVWDCWKRKMPRCKHLVTI